MRIDNKRCVPPVEEPSSSIAACQGDKSRAETMLRHIGSAGLVRNEFV